MIGDAKPRERPGPPDRCVRGGDVRQSRPTEGPRFATGSRHNATVQSPATESSFVLPDGLPRACCAISSSVRSEDRSQRCSNLFADLYPRKGGDVRRRRRRQQPPYTLWTCRLRTGCCCKSLSINTLSEDDKGYFLRLSSSWNLVAFEESSKATGICMCCRLRTEPYAVRSYDDSAHEGDKIPCERG